MKQQQLSRLSIVLFGSLAVAAVGCGSTSPAAKGTGGSGTPGGTGGMNGGGSGGMTSTNGTPLSPDTSGYVMTTADLGIMGAWYTYGDGQGADAATPGDCVNPLKGNHMASECSTVMVGATATGTGFPQDTPGTMCISGTAAKVINMGTSPDYSNIFGIGMGLDLSNAGGTAPKLPYDLTAHHVTAFSFHITGVPLSGLRVEFPTTETEAAGHDSYYATKVTADGDYTVSMAADTPTATGTPQNMDLAPSFNQGAGVTEPDFNPSAVLGIQFHIATNVSSTVTVTKMCVSNMTAVM